jgi:hypothetical protein
LIAAALLLPAIGCSNKGATHDAHDTPSASLPATGGPASGTPGTSAPPGTSFSPGASGSPAATAPGGTTSTTPGTTPSGSAQPGKPQPLPAKLTLAHGCVSPGGTQRADVKTAPGALVVIDTQYSDYKDGQVWGGIEQNGHADTNGNFTFAWTVRPGAPSGTAKVYLAVATQDHSGQDTKTFEVKLAC